ncbi:MULTISPECIES: hypothetical protein [Vibrio]|nr:MULTISPECIES: hypothetical protein [unclassified Vibrio]EJK2107548.1 hypothetical protein [Vibrio cholerae]MDQ2190377.1 hypothetical protein [Vibrio sp. A14(2019)]MDQ2196145.1 hypothetical protein [Vibrio sp. 2017_1457_11]NNN74989.1 hypothetical protein [Vibrio sp. B7]EJL6548743.1 hypothetical protein [Vibrio cholerae]
MSNPSQSNNLLYFKAPLMWTFSDPVHGNYHFDVNARITEYPHLKTIILQLNEGLYGLHCKGFALKSLGQYRRAIDMFLLYLNTENTVDNIADCDYEFLLSYLKWFQLRPLQEGERKGKRRKSIGIARLIPKLLVSIAELQPDSVHVDVLLGHLPSVRGIPSSPREPYSKREFRQILKACKSIVDLDKKAEWQGADSVVLAAAAVLMSIYTLANKSDILRLQVDSMYPHPHDPERRVCFAFYKPRAKHRTIIKDFSNIDEREIEMFAESRLFHMSAKGLFDYLKERSDKYREQTSNDIRESIWLYESSSWGSRGCVTSLKAGYLDSSRNKNQNAVVPLDVIADLYDLRDDQDQELRIRISRLRPTCVQILRRYGSVASVSRILGHKLNFGMSYSPTTERHYLNASPEQKARISLLLSRLHDYSVSGGVETWIQYEQQNVLTEAQKDELDLLQSDSRFKTHVASCNNPKNKEQSLSSGPHCLDFMQCLLCPHMVILETDLWRLFSFQRALRHDFESGRIPSASWLKRYGIYLKTLEDDIPHAFRHRPLVVKKAKERAEQAPYPLWNLNDQSYLAQMLSMVE